MQALFRNFVGLFIILSVLLADVAGANGTDGEIFLRHSLEATPLSPIMHIYAIQYGYMLTRNDELLIAPAFSNIQYEFGFLRAPSLAVGYRRYLWRNLNVEYQLWPSYSYFYDYEEKRWYEGFDLWNEFRTGYRFDFEIGQTSLYVLPQVMFGFGLYPGNKSERFLEATRDEGVFIAPLVFLGIKLF